VLPTARPDDALLDVAVLMPPERVSWISLAWALLRRNPTLPLMELFRGNHLVLTSTRNHLCQVDGELIPPRRC
jgi:diacylglycerol kinase (ATP)